MNATRFNFDMHSLLIPAIFPSLSFFIFFFMLCFTFSSVRFSARTENYRPESWHLDCSATHSRNRNWLNWIIGHVRMKQNRFVVWTQPPSHNTQDKHYPQCLNHHFYVNEKFHSFPTNFTRPVERTLLCEMARECVSCWRGVKKPNTNISIPIK